jgi:peptidoglycan-N-acetylglucosamine deacetylase
VASREQRRRQIAARRLRVRRQRRALAAALVLACVVVALLAVTSSGGGGPSQKHLAGGGASAKSKHKRPRPNPVDTVLGYTGYVLRGTRHRREIALTFDDGPSPYTPAILKILRRRHATATFFPIGQSINAYPKLLKRVRRRGYPIGDHTMTHPLMGHLPRGRQASELDRQAQLVRRGGGRTPRLFRPPDGSFDQDTLGLIRERRMLMVLWSVNPQDYFRPGTPAIVSRVLSAARPGAIVLMHDGGGDRSQTVAALPTIIRKLRARGFRLVTVPQMLRDAPPRRGQGPPPNLAGV